MACLDKAAGEAQPLMQGFLLFAEPALLALEFDAERLAPPQDEQVREARYHTPRLELRATDLPAAAVAYRGEDSILGERKGEIFGSRFVKLRFAEWQETCAHQDALAKACTLRSRMVAYSAATAIGGNQRGQSTLSRIGMMMPRKSRRLVNTIAGSA